MQKNVSIYVFALIMTALLITVFIGCANTDGTDVTTDTTVTEYESADPGSATDSDAKSDPSTDKQNPATEPAVTTNAPTASTDPPSGGGESETGHITSPEPPTTSEKPVTTTHTEPVIVTTTTTAKATDTTKVTTTTTKKITTTAPVAVDPDIGKSVTVTFKVNDTNVGRLTGSTTQTIKFGQTATTTVTASSGKLGYKFVKWSDGVTSATRSGESFRNNTTLTAIFDVDALELPILMITTETGKDVTSKTEYINGTISVKNVDDKYLLDELDMQIRGRGNYTWSSTFSGDPMYNKRPYRIKLSEKQKLAGIGEGKAKNWVLLADHCDQSLLRNNIVYSFAKSLDHILWEPSCQSVEVYLNGEYHGVYLLCEQIDVNSNKINISEDYSSSTIAFLAMYSGYADANAADGFSMGGQKYEIKNDLSENATLAAKQKQYIISELQKCWDAITANNPNQATIESLIDIDSVIDTYIVHELFKNLDTGWDNFYMFKDIQDDKLHFGPVWDFDQCSGNADVGVDDPTGIRGGDTQPWYSNLLKQSWFKKKLQARWKELKPEIDKIPSMIIEKAGSGYNSYCRNFDRWKIFGYKINRETYVRQFTTYKQHYEYFAEFVTTRTAWLDNYWGPTFAFDGTLTLSGRGTASSPYIVASADDFVNICLCMTNNQSFSGKYFRQTADIDLSTIQGYNGVGASCTFAGIYDGNGYTINVSFSGGGDGCVFPYVSGVVMNVITTGSINGNGIIAGIARSVRTGGAIINCASYINLTSSGNVGGIVGSNQSDSTIMGCYFGGTINSAGATGPINVWYSDRPGSFSDNYYRSGLPNSTGGADNGQSETEISSVTQNVAAALNNARENAASKVSAVSVSNLCTWSVSNGRLVLSHK